MMEPALIVWDVRHLASENYSDCQGIDHPFLSFFFFSHKKVGSLPILCATQQFMKAKHFDKN